MIPDETALLGALALSRWADEPRPELELRAGGAICPTQKEATRVR